MRGDDAARNAARTLPPLPSPAPIPPCLVPRRLSFDENVRAKEGGKETTGKALRLPPYTLLKVSCGSSPVTRVSRSPLP